MNNISSQIVIVVSALMAGFMPAALAEQSGPDVRATCFELGATPESLTALGMGLSTIQDAFGRLADEDTLVYALRQHQSDVATLAASLQTTSAALRAEPEPPEAARLQGEIDAINGLIAAAHAATIDARTQLIAILLPPSVDSTTAARVLAPGSLPPAYRAAVLTDAQVEELSAALDAERFALARGTTLDSGVQQTLASYRSIPEIAQALAFQQLHLPTVQQLFLLWE